jgi:carbonic anhydrase
MTISRLFVSRQSANQEILMKFRACLLITACFVVPAVAGEASHWGYEGESGPQNWGKLSPENVMCETGRNQAPINIAGALHASPKLLQPKYPAGSREIVNNGHTVQVDFEPGNTVVVDNVKFTLKQMHFHAPSENQIAGRSFPMEAHFVHADAQGNLLVVALMFQEGQANRALAKVWTAMPKTEGPASPLPNVVTPAAFMPKSMSYYRFSGSLTTPPCSEGVRWLVLKTPVSAAKTQIAAFEHAIGHHNNRPVQPLNGRVVIE